MKPNRLFIHFSLLLILIIPFQSQAQWVHKSFDFDNISRDYWVYVSPNYNPTNPASLVVTLHGMGDNDTNFRNMGFNLVADTANFIVLVPNAVPFNSSNVLVQAVIGGSRTWNSGAGVNVPLVGSVFPNSEINDVGFLNEIVDVTLADYSINPKRVYMCGFSKGGFMTQRMALESNGRYAAFATAAGTFGISLTNPNPGRGIPLAHFNGTLDEKVNWSSGIPPLFEVYVDSMINFWVDHNNCDLTPIHTNLPDTENDGYTVEHDLYANGDDGSVLEVFKVNNAGHIWLGFDNDISYTLEMWKFFSRYTFETAGTNEESSTNTVLVYPNPVSEKLTIEFSEDGKGPYFLTLVDMKGREIMNLKNQHQKIHLDLESVKSGIYLLNMKNKTLNITKRIVVH
ncbi:MAG TPA: T9SS type A sorting domain-containing protein [Brumimicrobium sp.]|nr:T9SS type A sorting domain-containing protein [Brumimicrobium sp.]